MASNESINLNLSSLIEISRLSSFFFVMAFTLNRNDWVFLSNRQWIWTYTHANKKLLTTNYQNNWSQNKNEIKPENLSSKLDEIWHSLMGTDQVYCTYICFLCSFIWCRTMIHFNAYRLFWSYIESKQTQNQSNVHVFNFYFHMQFVDFLSSYATVWFVCWRHCLLGKLHFACVCLYYFPIHFHIA